MQKVAVISSSQMTPVLVDGEVTVVWPVVPSGWPCSFVTTCAAAGEVAKSRAMMASFISNPDLVVDAVLVFAGRAPVALWRHFLHDGAHPRNYFDSTPAQSLLGLAVPPLCFSVLS